MSSIVVEIRIRLQDHVIRSPYTDPPEGSRQLEPAFAQPFSPKPSGRSTVSSLYTKFLKTMRVFEELCRNVNILNRQTIPYTSHSQDV